MGKGIYTAIIAIIVIAVVGIAGVSLQSLQIKVEKGPTKIEQTSKNQETDSNLPSIKEPIKETQQTPPPGPTAPTTTTTANPPATTPEPQTFEGIDNYPSISGSLKPSNPSLGQSFNFTISATDDKGVNKISWQSSKAFSNYGQSGSFDCNLQTACSNTWQLIAKEEGSHQLTATAIDSSGKDGKLILEATVQPAIPVKSTAPTPVPTTTTSNTSSQPAVAEDKCSSNSGCGYKQICQSGKCVSVACTSDSHCTGCKRCSGNNCVSCGSGPYGCYC